MDMVSKCTKFDEDTPSRSEVKFNERRREWKLRRMESSKSTSVRPVYRSPTREARRAAIHRVEHEYELF